MRIPNKFNGYMSDGRRLYPDPATSAIIASSLASSAAPIAASTTAAGLTAAGTAAAAGAGASAIPGIVGSAAPALTGAVAPAATTAATNLGTTAALEASKQGIIQGGADVMAQEAAKQAGQQVAKEGIMTGAKDAAQNQVLEAFSKPATDLSQYQQFVPEASNAAPQLVPQAAPPGTPPAGNYSLNPALNTQTGTGTSLKLPTGTGTGADPYSGTTLTNISGGSQGLGTSGGVEVGEASLQAGNLATKSAPSKLMEGFNTAKEFAGDAAKFAKDNPLLTTGGIMLAQNMMQPSYDSGKKKSSKGYGGGSGDFKYGEPSTGRYVPIFEPTPYAMGGPVEQMSAQNAIGSNTGYPMANLQTPMYTNPQMSRPMATNVIAPSADTGVGTYTGEARMADGGKVNAFEKMMKEDEARRKQVDAQARADIEQEARSLAGRTKPYSRTQSTNTPYAAALKELQAMGKKYGIKTITPEKTNIDLMGDQDQMEYAANGGIMHGLGGYSDGGRLLKGPGDGVSDSIPAVIGRKQPARLADGEFVIPARIVSELGNGSTEAGARKLYAMMERIQKQRGKTVGKGKVAVNSKASKHLPA
jgi:hypothetical protein